MNIHGYQPTSTINTMPAAKSPMQDVGKAAGGEQNFAALLQAYTQQVNHDSKAAGKAAVALASGVDTGKGTAETLLAIKQAGLSFQMMLGVRNKLVDAYREIIRMQV